MRCEIPFFGVTHVVHEREDVRTVFTNDGSDFVLAPVMGPLAPYFGTRSVICLDGSPHLARRKVVLPAFAGAALPAMESELRELAREALPNWCKSEEVPVLTAAQALTFAAILCVAFGVRDREQAAELGELLRAHFIAAGRGEVTDAEPVRQLVQDLLDARRRSGENRPDLLGLLLEARQEDGAALDDATLRDELLTTLTAGHETTATALAWASIVLADRPKLFLQLRAERRAGGADLLDATLTELLRLYPPLMGTSRVATREVTLAGHRLPANTSVTLSAQLAHTDSRRYADPKAFRPERFLGSKPTSVDYFPFGGGRHRCAGAAFARLELRVVIETLLEGYRLTREGPSPPAALIVNTQVPRDGALVQVAPER